MSQSPYSPEANPWWWNPARPAVVEAPEWFRAKLAEVDPELKVIWNAHRERWQVWTRSARISHPVCTGWLMLFPVQYADGTYCPLDERTIAKVYEVSAQKWGNARNYWSRIEAEIARDKEKALIDRYESVNDTSGDYYDYLQPKVSMCGPSNGSKCSNL